MPGGRFAAGPGNGIRACMGMKRAHPGVAAIGWRSGKHAVWQRDRHNGRRGGSPSPGQVNQRRYEALRAFFTEGLTYEQAGARFGYTRWAMIDLVRQHRAGKLELFAPPGKPGPPPGVAPAKDRARGRVIELRRQGLSAYEISRRLAAEGTPLNRTSVGEVLAEEGFGRLLRHPEPEASINPATAGRDTNLPAAKVLDFATWPERLETTRAGLLLAVPDLVSLDLPALVSAAGYPGTRVIPGISWLLSLLALKLTRTRRVSHVDDLLADPAAGLFAGMAVLPKKTVLTDYSYRLSHEHQQRFLAALDKKMIAAGWPARRRRSSTWISTPSCTGAAIRCWKSTTSPRAPSAPGPC